MELVQKEAQKGESTHEDRYHVNPEPVNIHETPYDNRQIRSLLFSVSVPGFPPVKSCPFIMLYSILLYQILVPERHKFPGITQRPDNVHTAGDFPVFTGKSIMMEIWTRKEDSAEDSFRFFNSKCGIPNSESPCDRDSPGVMHEYSGCRFNRD